MHFQIVVVVYVYVYVYACASAFLFVHVYVYVYIHVVKLVAFPGFAKTSLIIGPSLVSKPTPRNSNSLIFLILLKRASQETIEGSPFFDWYGPSLTNVKERKLGLVINRSADEILATHVALQKTLSRRVQERPGSPFWWRFGGVLLAQGRSRKSNNTLTEPLPLTMNPSQDVSITKTQALLI